MPVPVVLSLAALAIALLLVALGLHLAVAGRSPWPGDTFWLWSRGPAAGRTPRPRVVGWGYVALGAGLSVPQLLRVAVYLGLVPDSLPPMAVSVTLAFAGLGTSVVLLRRATARPPDGDGSR
jgi:hypothetical protein